MKLEIIHTPLGILTFFLISGVIIVNGFTDAPASISGVVSSKIWELKKACVTCGIFNLLGVVLFSFFSGKVVENIFDSAQFGSFGAECICASLLGVILFSLVAWIFSMPSSETHALISCICGSSLAATGVKGIEIFLSSVFCMVISCIFTIILSLGSSLVFKKADFGYKRLEKAACITSSFMHGAQDGQKFVGLLALLSAETCFSGAFSFLSCLYVGVLMLAGTLICGKKIIASLGNDIVKNNEKIAFMSDFSSTVCILLFSLIGFSISTGNIKACSLVGAGLGEKQRINYMTMLKIIIVSAITFPICIILGFYLARLFILIF